MAMFYDNAVDLLSSDSLTAFILMLAGFLACHLIHALRYSFMGGYGTFFDKIKKFIKVLFFLKI
ncbi:MAG: hypothetical protein PHT91_01195 [Candidatus Nanoarchaeia archaeon]|nr:hypothetical protein [Candidatus Nanoarchaeia archaeon]MDD5053816.1 hypothetical protein [Candidatus Nanoarchaeia archaeon]MDD5499474.1 hypothetical protein [Candidatus Nanoarchaeia archaeon]